MSRALQTLCARGELDRALDLLSRMDTHPSANAYLSLLKACKKSRSKALAQAKQVHSHLSLHRVPLTGLLGDYLIVTLAMCGAIDDALHTSHTLPCRTVFSWTSIISAYADCGQGHDALRIYQCMVQDGVEPSSHTFLALFKACGSIPDLEQGKNLHAYARRKGFASDVFVGNAIVSMYTKCGAIVEAEDAFGALSQLTLSSWNSMLSVYVEHGEAGKALQLYTQMQEDGVEPSQYTFISLFKACGSIQDLKKGKKIHNDACKKGYTGDIVIGSTLVSMYGKCGAIIEAEDVFGTSPYQDVVLWNAMLSAYVEQDHGEKALRLYAQMQDEGVNPSQRTSVIALQACATLAKKEEVLLLEGRPMKVTPFRIGQALHADASKKGYLSDAFIGTTLVSIYGKCGAIVEAEDVFSALSQRDVVLWNAMLSAYVEHGQGEKALCLFTQMEKESKSPDQPTFVTALQAVTLIEKEAALLSEGQFSKGMSLEIGQALHADACRKGLASDVFVGSTLVSMYGRCGAIVEAEDAFCGLSQRTVVSWNAMLSAYVEQGQGEKALQLYTQMQVEGLSPDQLTLMIALQACGTLTDKEEDFHVEGRSAKVKPFEIGQALHAEAYRKSFLSDVSLCNTLVSMYGKCGAIVEAEHVFGALSQQRTVVSWNAMLLAYVEQGQGEKALLLYTGMQEEIVHLDLLTFVFALQACVILAEKEGAPLVEGPSAKMMSLEIGRAIHANCHNKGFASHVFVGNTLVRMYGKCGAIMEAEEVLGALCLADAHGKGLASERLVGSTLVDMYGKCGAVVKAEDVLGGLSVRDVVSWNAMLSTYTEQGQGEKAVRLYRQMQEQHVTLDYVSITCILQACSTTGSLEICKQLHFHIVSAGYDQIPSVAASLIHAYGSCASMVDGQAFLGNLLEPDIVSWNACIAGHAGEGNSLASLHMFEKLTLTHIKPDEPTFSSVLSACSQTGLVVTGIQYFESMSRDYGRTSDSNHYGRLLGLLGRAGDFKRIENMLERMPMQANLTTWLSLLGACHTHGNVELAKWVYNHAVNLQPSQATAYVLMSNIYANAELQERAEEVENCGQRWCMEEG